ncbi:MAG: alpha/beta hydrolase [Marinobacterium sp.]
MTKTTTTPSGDHSASVFKACRLRESLDTFVPGVQTLCSSEVQAYLDHYGLQQAAAVSCYSIGTELVGEIELVVQHFRRAHSRGTVVLVHGYTDHAGLYRHLITHLLEQHWDVLVYDLPGHGLSGGQRLVIDSFDTYARQLSTILRRHEQRLTAPWVGLGQSTGCAIWLQAQLGGHLHNLPLKDRILLSPLIRPRHYSRIELTYRLLHWCIRRVHREPTESSNDGEFMHFVRYLDPLQGHFVDVGWVGAMLDWVVQVEAAAAQDMPALVIQGTDDRTLEWVHNLDVLSELLPNANIERLTAARHHLVNEAAPWRREVFDRISERLRRRERLRSMPMVVGE